MSGASSHWPDVRDKPGFLHRLMCELAGGAQLSLEGDLSAGRFEGALVVSRDETDVLKRSTIWPRQDFVVLCLEPDTVAAIFKQVMAAGLKRNIVHAQIQRRGVLELGAYDNFQPGCVVTGPGVPATLLAELAGAGVVRSFEVATRPPSDGPMSS